MFGKPQRGATQRSHSEARPLVPTWLWLMVLSLFGLFLAVLLYLWQPWQPTTRGAADPQKTSDSTKNAEHNGEQSSDFAFYDLLPKQQVTPIPQQEVPLNGNSKDAAQPLPDLDSADPTDTLANDNAQNAPNPDPITSTDRESVYILQVNSFDNPDDADRQRAEVILAGLSADVRQTTSADGTVWYRVVSGPYSARSEAVQAQKMLQDSGVDALVVEQP